MTRKKVLINDAWKFHLGDLTTSNITWDLTKNGVCHDSGARKLLDDSKWDTVNLPHDYVVESSFVDKKDTKYNQVAPVNYEERYHFRDNNALYECNGSHMKDIAWYRYHFKHDANDNQTRTYLWFEGIYRNSSIYVNDCFADHHESGYTPIIVDVTDSLYSDVENVLAVRVDPTEQEGWWYEGGGIYRNVYMITVNNLHIKPNGFFVYADEFNSDYTSCKLHIKATVRNRNLKVNRIELRFGIYDENNKLCKKLSMNGDINGFEDKDFLEEAIMESPILWDTNHPHRYTVKTQIVSNGEVLDEYEEHFGIREAKFDADKGFLLNGKAIKLNGVCCHQDHAGVGVAVPYGVDEYRIDKLLEMSCNALRTSHNPPSPQLIEICDKKGMLVMAENRLLNSSPENIKQLIDLIETFRNNPSVILWSIANEEEFIQWKPISGKITRTLVNTIKTIDKTRAVTSAIPLISWLNNYKTEPAETTLHYSDEMDVMGFNYSYSQWLRFHELRPNQPIVISEDMSGTLTRDCYESNEADAHSNNVHDKNAAGLSTMNELALRLETVDTNPCLSGIFLWTGFAYRGEPTSNWPAVVADFGLLDLCGFPKDTYHYYRSVWQKTPYMKLVPSSWNFPNQIGVKKSVYAFTNCDKAELFLNGKSCGISDVTKYGWAEWEIAYQSGEIKAVALSENKEYVDIVSTTSSPYALKINKHKYSNQPNGKTCYILDISVVDAENRIVPYSNNHIKFEFSSEVSYLGAGNGDPSSHENDKAACRNAFHGLCQAIVEIEENKDLYFKASSDGLVEARVDLC